MESEKVPMSRLEVNLLRVLQETQQMASGARTRDWTFQKFVASRRLVVLYGSETGTAQDLAHRVARLAKQRHYTPVVAPMNNYAGAIECLAGEITVDKLQQFERLSRKIVSQKLEHVTDSSLDEQKYFQSLNLLIEKAKTALDKERESTDSDIVSVEVNENFYSKLPPLAVVFIAATTGQGEDPDNMKLFFSHIWSKRQNRLLFSGVKFGVIGLGDSSYQKFNYTSKRLNNLLTYLGGSAILNIGLGDDQHDLGPDFVADSWLEQFWSKMDQLYPLPEGVPPLSSDIQPPASFNVTFCDSDDAEELKSRSNSDSTDQQKLKAIASSAIGTNNVSPCFSAITKLERVTAEDHFQDVRLVEFDVQDIATPHKPGDVLMLQPENLDAHVQEFLSVLGLDGNKRFIVEPADCQSGSFNIPNTVLKQPCTIAECVKKYFDIMSVPKRYFFELLSFFTTDEDEKEKYQEFASSIGQQDLYDYCNRPKRSIVEVLADFSHTQNNIPFEYLFDLIPMIRPRAYSIASSAVMFPGKAQILVAVVNYKTILRRSRLGVCSNWLTTLKISDKVNVWIKKGTLKFPLIDRVETENTSDESIANCPPVIMIGPGTGCAPFRSYIQERIALGLTNSPLLLYFGCRGEHSDYFFKEEWQQQAGKKQLELYTAFSRDQEDKIYVQQRLRESSSRLWQLIDHQAAEVYFAGNAKRVPIDVYDALTFACNRGLGGDDAKTTQYMKKVFDKRYQTETWA